jgi:phosphatidylserine decarboxylase
MDAAQLSLFTLLLGALTAGGFFYWRYVWFFRNPTRTPPADDGILSPADGTVVYVKQVQPFEEVVVIKQGIAARVTDILREEIAEPKWVIGIFMSPFDVHYNRIPLAGQVDFIRHHPPAGSNLPMAPMHWRTLANRFPHYANSLHIIQNERLVTRINSFYKNIPLSYYVVQIAGKHVNGIDSYVKEGKSVQRGDIFGMIRIGSQVDLILPWRARLNARVKAGDKVSAGETIVMD